MTRLCLAIIGVGLIGGSLGLALKDRLGEDIRITGLCRTQESMDKAVALGAVDMATSDVEQVVGEADIVFLSPPGNDSDGCRKHETVYMGAFAKPPAEGYLLYRGAPDDGEGAQRG